MSLDVFQQVMALSFTSNLANYLNGTQECLQKALQDALPSEFPDGEWQLVWGPIVRKHLEPDNPTTGPDNSWYVAFHPSLKFENGSVHPTYIIAIAGTPPGAWHVWETQNLSVDTVTDFNAWVDEGIQTCPIPAEDIKPDTPYISTGTVNTVHFMLNTLTPMGAISPSTTLLDFFADLDMSTSPRFITTGHSLGGTLSPSLALTLVLAGVISTDSTWTYPSAGLSPGNTTFAELFAKKLPACKSDGVHTYQRWNLNLVNTLDPAPQAWCTLAEISKQQNMFNIPTIYSEPAIDLVSGVVQLGAFHTNKSGVQYVPLPSQYFTGTLPDKTPCALEHFIAIAIREHIDAYSDEVGVNIPPTPTPCLPGCEITKKPEVEKQFNYPIIAGLEWAREHPKEAEKEIEREVGTAKA